MSWFQKLLPTKIRAEGEKKGVPEGLWSKCKSCQAVLYRAELERNLFVCPKCNYHQRIGARVRLESFLDKDSWQEIGDDFQAIDRLKFRDSKKYKDRISAAQKKTGETEAIVVYAGALMQMPVTAASFDFFYLGGSMGAALGERFVQGINFSIERKTPFICFTASGGARMQEGLFSLMQMAKTSAALTKLSEHNLPYIVVLTDPTTGGVSASLATLGDLILAEPKALIGFTGPRVIEQTIRHTLPEGFQRSEFLKEHGAIDAIVDRRHLRQEVASLLSKLMHQKEPQPEVVEDETHESSDAE